MRASPVSTATKVTALSRNTHPVPTAATSRPAIAGPTTRAVLNVIEFRATALASAPDPTISPANDWRTGPSSAEMQPRSTHST